MALNPLFVVAPSIQQYFVDKDTGQPLSGGKLYTFRDINRTEPKTVYTLAGNAANYTYVPLNNPITLTAAGVPGDALGNPIILYWFPYDAEGNLDLYYIEVRDSNGVLQQTVQAWPNPQVTGSTTVVDNVINYVPNGQFLAHTTPPNNELVAGSNVIAQGGFSIELPATVHSTNTLTFLNEANGDIPSLPRYVAELDVQSAGSPNDEFKKVRIKWRDVNKFTLPGSPTIETHTFAFWAESTVSTPFTVQVYKFFGSASPTPPIFYDIGVGSITTTGQFFNFNFSFSSNQGTIIDTVNNDDFVAIDILLPVNITFTADFSDFIMSDTVMEYEQFPAQTNADMLTRGVAGWMPTPDGFGFDLYLPLVLTKEGMVFDTTEVGNIESSVKPIPNPSSVLTNDNRMPCDGSTYIVKEFALNGIPYQRLFNFLVAGSPIDIPLYGTGANFVTALIPYSGTPNPPNNQMGLRITYNSAGAGSPAAADGLVSTGLNFHNMLIYNGSTSGTASLGIFASNSAGATVLAVPVSGNTLVIQDITTGFTIAPTLLTTFQVNQGYTIVCLSGAALVRVGAGAYFNFFSNATDYYVWYNVDNTNTDPAPGGRIGIQVLIAATYDAQDVCDVTVEALNGFQSTLINVPASNTQNPGQAAPPGGSWLTFSANPAALRNFFVWFQFNGTGTQPDIPGAIGIMVNNTTGATSTNVRDNIRGAINSYQFQSPDFRGVFFRCADPNGTWDLDANFRWSYTRRVSGNNPGTYEYQQFLAHTHPITFLTSNPAGIQTGPGFAFVSVTTGFSGGNETRPINTTVYPFIRY